VATVAVIGIGTDVLEVARMHSALDRTPTLLGRLFTEAEQAVRTPARLAARFAAKEAVAKALGTGMSGFGFRDIEVVGDEDGKPEVRLHGGAAVAARDRGVTRIHLSLSHTSTVAVANAVAES
jgi:holo-[acyl-carrier protein] synthase